MQDLRSHLTRHGGRRSTDARDSEIGNLIREVTENYTFRIVHRGDGGRLAIALPTQRQRMRMKRTIGEQIR